jgi:4-amino-4-deoxy-L-arabinose transferase-like glycosyltransferase
VTCRPSGRILALIGLLVLYAALRLPHLGALPPFDDESNYAWDALLVDAAVRARAWDWLFVSLHDGVPPLFPLMLALLTRTSLDPIIAARVLSVLTGAATTALLYLAGCAWAAPSTGLLAALLYIVCPFAVFTDRIGLLDGLLATWILLGAMLAWRALAGAPRHAARWGAAAGVALGAALLTKSLGLLGLALPALAVRFSRAPVGEGAMPARRRRVAVELAYVVALLVWSVLLFSGRLSNLLYPFHLQAGVAQTHTAGGLLARLLASLGSLIGYAGAYLTPPLAVALGASLVWCLWRGPGPARYLAWWVVLAAAALVATAGSFFPPRYLFPLLPPLLLCGALAARCLVARLGARRGWAAVAALGVAALAWAVPFDRALLADPAQAPLPAIDRSQYITGWPAGYGLPAALETARRVGGAHLTLLVNGGTDPPFTQAQLALRDLGGVRIVGVDLAANTRRTCGGTVTLALLDTPRDSEGAFRAAHATWQRLATYPRPGAGGAYVLYRCP